MGIISDKDRDRQKSDRRNHNAGFVLLGAVTNFFDTFGIGSFATTTVALKGLKKVPDEYIPGTLIVGHALPTVAQAAIFVAIVQVDLLTLIGMVAAAVAGSWAGAGVLRKASRRSIQLVMAFALLWASVMMVLTNLGLLPLGGEALGLSGWKLVLAVCVNFVLGALMTFGVGLYAPCMILVSLLGMDPVAAFPIMMGSCALLMPVSAIRLVKDGRFDRWVAFGLAVGGVPAVLFAALVIKSLPTDALRWIVAVVVLIAALQMLSGDRRVAT